MNRILLLGIFIIGISNSFAAEPVKKIIFHCPDQSNTVSNDFKPIYAENKLGQTFVPAQKQLSFFRVKAVKCDSSKSKIVSGDENAIPELRLWECGNDYPATIAKLPVSIATGNQSLYFNGTLFFRLDTPIKPQTPYYIELAAFGSAVPYYNIYYNYGKDPYPAGSFVPGSGYRWATSDLNFSSCYPVESSEKLTEVPELIEIQFDQAMNTEKTKVNLDIPGGKNKTSSIIWKEKSNAFIAVGKIAENTENLKGSIKINSFTETGIEKLDEIPFVISKEKAVANPEAVKKAENKKTDTADSSPSPVTEKLIKGIVKASFADIKPSAKQVEFSINIWTEPIIGMHIVPENVDTETLKSFKEHNINTVSISLPINLLENIDQIKTKIDMLHKNGFLVYWLVPLAPAGYDKEILKTGDGFKIAWNGEVTKEYCFNNPFVQKAFLSNMNRCIDEFQKNNILFNAVIMNEPGRNAGEFCYCNYCKEKFAKEFNFDMPEPVKTAGLKKEIPVCWPSGVPKQEYIKKQDEEKWKKMSIFYYTPVTERIRDIFRIFQQKFPAVSCQVTTLTDIAPYYGIDFWDGVTGLEATSGIQTAIYWAVGGHSPETVGDPKLAKKFVGKAKAKNISCYYWLQGYDAGDNSKPLKSGEIKIAVKEAFASNVDGILIWSYLNPILGPWDHPFHWPEFFSEFKDATNPYLKVSEVSEQNIKLKEGEKKSITLENNGSYGAYNLEYALSKGILSLTVKRNGFCTLKKEINLAEISKKN